MTARSGAATARPAARLAAIALGGAAAHAVRAGLRARPPGGAARWERTNHRGGQVTLLAGPSAAGGLAAACLLLPGVPPRLRLAAALAAAGAGGFGVLDDLAERGGSKGLRGHLGALRRGEVTTGAAKLLGIGAVGLASAALAGGPAAGQRADPGADRGGRARRAVRRAAAVAEGGALVAGTANLLNLFDLRPGRALKVALLAAAPSVPAAAPAGVLAAATAGVAAALLPEDLAERAMLGDGGANALGAVLGIVLLGRCRPGTRHLAVGVVTGLTLASERVSFTKVIAATPGLRELDALGRRPADR